MSKPSEFLSVQPESASTLEEALEFAWQQVIKAQNSPYPNLKQPSLTNAEFVDLIAGERGVLDWQPNDTLEQRRKTAGDAFNIHRLAGTRTGLSVALQAIDADLEVTPWHKMANPPGPYHIDVVAWRENAPITQENTQRVRDRLEYTKSERDTISLTMAMALKTSHAISGGMSRASVIDDAAANALMPPIETLSAPVAISCAHHGTASQSDAFKGMAPQTETLTVSLGAAGGVHATLSAEFYFHGVSP